jgi:farnesyl diphosphate synthase
MPVETIDRSRAEFEAEATWVRSQIDGLFERLLVSRGDGRDGLFAAMRHAAIGGGKRLRPLLAIAA